MPPKPITTNTLFYGDNLDILREHIASESVDLIYLDPPFNSNRNYNVLFKDEKGADSESQITAFEDTWHWNASAEESFAYLVTETALGEMMGAMLTLTGRSQMGAYLVMMAVRLVELHRVLKPTGSLYLHCDPTAGHYLKVILDGIFGVAQYRHQIVWRRTSAHNDPKGYGNNYDLIFFYSKTKNYTWNKTYQPYDPEYVKKYYRYKDPDGRLYASGDVAAAGPGPARLFNGVLREPPTGSHWRFSQENIDRLIAEGRIFFTANGFPRFKRYLDEMNGMPVQALWDDIQPVVSWSNEGLGYPTQKPLTLLERIINASSNPGDVVLDPFCGCGTAVAAAQKLGRKWIGIDITHLSIALQKYRLEQMFPSITFTVIGEPEDIGAARQLATDDRYQFQWWALSLVRARPLGGESGSKTGKKGSDKGIDGVINFIDDTTGKPKRVLVQVKSGKVKSGDIRDLVGTVQRENAQIGVFVTLEAPSRDMLTEATSAGFYRSSGWNQNYPKMQILTIADLLRGEEVKMPPPFGTFKQAQRADQVDAEQQGLDL